MGTIVLIQAKCLLYRLKTLKGEMFVKKLLSILSVGLLAVGLVACGQEESEPKETTPSEQKDVDSNTPKAEAKTENKEEKSKKDVAEIKVGETAETDDFDSYSLLASKEFNQTIDVSPITITVKSANIVTIEGVKDEYASEMMKEIGYKDSEPFTYLKIDYSAENTSEQNVSMNFPIYTIILNTGEQINVSDKDFISEWGDSDYYSKAKQDDLQSAVPIKSNPDEVTSFRIITDDVFNENIDVVSGAKEANFELK